LASSGDDDSMTQNICARMTILVDETMKHLASVDRETRTLHAENQRLISETDTCQQNTTDLLHDAEDAKAYLGLCVTDSRVTSQKLGAMEEDWKSAQAQNQQLMMETEQCRQELAAHVESAAKEPKIELKTCQAELISAARDTRTCKKALTECTGVKNDLWVRHDTCVVRARDIRKRNEQLEAENLSLLYEIEHIKTTKHHLRGFPLWRYFRRLWRMVLPKRFRGVE
jgi:chromosome segregation ATPase